jgi:hypothetical protein
MEEYSGIDKAEIDIAPSIAEQEMPVFHDEVAIATVLSSRDAIYGEQVREIAQALHTQVYLDKDFITEADINDQGIFIDKYSHRSTYLLSEGEHRRSACRYIHANKKDGILSLPTAENFSLDPDIIKKVAEVNRLSDLKPNDVIEVSGLTSIQLLDPSFRRHGRREELDATRLLYASIIRHSLDEGHKLWLLNIDERLLRSLEILIGREQVNRLGESRQYIGPATVPVAINPQEVVRAAFTDTSDFGEVKRQYLLESLPGVSGRHLPTDIKDMLTAHDIPYDEDSRMRRLIHNRRALAYAAILGYSSARALPVGAIDEFQGSVPLLWAIDVGTAVPYTWGLIETVAAKAPIRRAVGASVAGGSFIAPYAYFWAEGQEYPPYVNAVVGGLIGTATLLEAAKVRKDRRIARELKASAVAS